MAAAACVHNSIYPSLVTATVLMLAVRISHPHKFPYSCWPVSLMHLESENARKPITKRTSTRSLFTTGDNQGANSYLPKLHSPLTGFSTTGAVDTHGGTSRKTIEERLPPVAMSSVTANQFPQARKKVIVDNRVSSSKQRTSSIQGTGTVSPSHRSPSPRRKSGSGYAYESDRGRGDSHRTRVHNATLSTGVSNAMSWTPSPSEYKALRNSVEVNVVRTPVVSPSRSKSSEILPTSTSRKLPATPTSARRSLPADPYHHTTPSSNEWSSSVLPSGHAMTTRSQSRHYTATTASSSSSSSTKHTYSSPIDSIMSSSSSNILPSSRSTSFNVEPQVHGGLVGLRNLGNTVSNTQTHTHTQ